MSPATPVTAQFIPANSPHAKASDEKAEASLEPYPQGEGKVPDHEFHAMEAEAEADAYAAKTLSRITRLRCVATLRWRTWSSSTSRTRTLPVGSHRVERGALREIPYTISSTSEVCCAGPSRNSTASSPPKNPAWHPISSPFNYRATPSLRGCRPVLAELSVSEAKERVLVNVYGAAQLTIGYEMSFSGGLDPPR